MMEFLAYIPPVPHNFYLSSKDSPEEPDKETGPLNC
jgi:hypothetical protein